MEAITHKSRAVRVAYRREWGILSSKSVLEVGKEDGGCLGDNREQMMCQCNQSSGGRTIIKPLAGSEPSELNKQVLRFRNLYLFCR